MAFFKKHWRETTGGVASFVAGFALSLQIGVAWWAGVICCIVGYAILLTSIKLRPSLGYATSWAGAGALTGAVFFISGLLVPGDRLRNAKAMGAAGVMTVLAVAAVVVPPRMMRKTYKGIKSLMKKGRRIGSDTDKNTSKTRSEPRKKRPEAKMASRSSRKSRQSKR